MTAALPCQPTLTLQSDFLNRPYLEVELSGLIYRTDTFYGTFLTQQGGFKQHRYEDG